MELRIDKEYMITSDDYQFTLNRVRVKGEDSVNAGEEYLVGLGYYGTLQMALKGYLKNNLRGNSDDITSVESLIKRLDEIEGKISDLTGRSNVKSETKQIKKEK